MSAISNLLNQIKTAIYGEEVRDSIHDAIEQCYTDVTNARTLAENATSAANTAANNANAKATAANTAANAANQAASQAETRTTTAINGIDQKINDIALVQANQPSSATNKIWVQPQSDEYQVPTWEEFSDVKSALFNNTSVTITTSNMETGSISTVNGQNKTGNTRYRTINTIHLGVGDIIKVEGSKFAIYEYSGSDATSAQFVQLNHALAVDSDPFVVTTDNYYRILLAYADDRTITDDNKSALLDTLSITDVEAKFAGKNQAVLYQVQTKTTVEKDTARTNIGAASQADMDAMISNVPHDHNLMGLSDLTTGYYIQGQNTAIGTNWQNALVSYSSSLYTPTAIDVSDYMGDDLVIAIATTDNHFGTRGVGFCDSNNLITTIVQEQHLTYAEEGGYLKARLKITDKFLFFSCSSKSYLQISVATDGKIIKELTDGIYVSADGSDDNIGNSKYPLATVNAALIKGCHDIFVKGGKYFQTIDLSLLSGNTLNLINCTPTKKAVFYAPGCVVTEEETTVSGYTNVYSATVTNTFANNNVWLFQDGVSDASTLIGNERMPEQRGYENRCHDTKIVKCSSETLADALTEIENATDYRWYVDSGTLYFSRPDTVSSAKPICASFGGTLFSGNSRAKTVNINGIDVKYMGINVDETSGSVIKDCSAVNVYGNGSYTFSRALEVQFIRCEAARAFTGSNGDGFNAHSTQTDDAFAHQTTAILIDCWSHDNMDDGISTHERSEFTIIGGLYEENAKGGGVTPSYGAHCTCIGVTARNNGEAGFLYYGAASADEGGVGGQMKCIDCVSDGNNTWSSVSSAGYKLTAAGQRAILINCKALNEDCAFYASNVDSDISLIDCGAYNCTNAKGGQIAVIVATNTTAVS